MNAPAMVAPSPVLRSLHKPGLVLEADDVFSCERCDGHGENRLGDTCYDCRGSGLLHGFSSLGEPMPVVVEAISEGRR